MALTSFTLRKTSGGSNLQKASALDNAIRSDGISPETVVSAITTGTNTFSANIITTNQVRLEWTLEDTLVNEGESGVVALLIVSSYSGEPVTIRDGVVVTTVTNQSLYTYYDDTPVVNQGRWVYYSLFAKYSNGTDHWYVRVATLYIQIPISYDSVESLWKKIPEYYRTLDYSQPSLTNGYTPLYAFLELFGNEVDRTRTLIESVALSNDPELAVTPALRELATEVGLEFNVDDLGTSKVRTLMDNIGKLRQQKGTIGSICSYISAMSGCQVEYKYNAALPKPHVFNVYAQRVNFISDPEFNNTTITFTHGNCGLPLSMGGMGYRTLSTTSTWGVHTYNNNVASASYPSVICTNNVLTVTTPAGATVNESVFIYPRIPFPYLGTQTYGTSYWYSGTSGASFIGLHTSTESQVTTWEGGTINENIYADTDWYSGLHPSFSSTNERPSYEYLPSTTGASATASRIPVLEFSMAPGSSISISDWLFEPATGGDYFSGNTREGGYIPIQTGTAGSGTFDYYWDTAGGGANNAYSYYLADHERTIKTTERVISQYIVPVTMLDYYSIVWDYYPGK